MQESIIRWLEQNDPQGQLLSLKTLNGGISSTMTVFETLSDSGTRLRRILRLPSKEVLAQNPDAAFIEYRVLKMLGKAGIATPRPLFFDPDGSCFGQPAIILSYIDGSVNLNPTQPAPYLSQIARQLASIHTTRIDPCLQNFLPKLELKLPHLDSISRTALEKRFDCSRALDALSANLPPPKLHQDCFLHGDPWPGNILWKNKQLVGVIDWEEPAWGDPLSDLAICRLEFDWLFGKDAAEHFTEQYFTHNPINKKHLPLWDLHACFRAGHQMHRWCKVYPGLNRPDVTEAHMERVRCDFVRDALACID